MNIKDQPNIFNSSKIICNFSSLSDGPMHPSHDSKTDVFNNIRKFTKSDKIALVRTIYEQRNFDIIVNIDSDSHFINETFEPIVKSDAIVTNIKGVTLALPVADCLAVTLHDPVNEVVAIAHMGRHATLEDLLPKLLKHMGEKYKTDPADLKAFFSPSIKKSHYFMEYWDETQMSGYFEHKNNVYYLDIPGFNKQQLIENGVLESNIEISPINTATDANYGSHFVHKIDPNKPQSRFLVTISLK